MGMISILSPYSSPPTALFPISLLLVTSTHIPGVDKGRVQGRHSLLRMRSLMKNAGDKIAADLKSLKVTYTPSDLPRLSTPLPP